LLAERSEPELDFSILDFTQDKPEANEAKLVFKVELNQNGLPMQGAQISIPDIGPFGFTDDRGELISWISVSPPESPGIRSEIISVDIAVRLTFIKNT